MGVRPFSAPLSKTYNPDQPRDPEGQWTSAGGGSLRRSDRGGYVAPSGHFLERAPGNQWNVWESEAAYDRGSPDGLIETVRSLAEAKASIGLRKFNPSQPRDESGRWVDWKTVVSANNGFGLAAGQVEDYIERTMGVSPDRLSWSSERLSVTHAADGVLEGHVAHLADRYRSGGEGALPPVVAIERPDGRLERVDGNHRLNAAKAAGLSSLPAFIGRVKVKKYNPNQPRDNRGRWTDGGTSSRNQETVGHMVGARGDNSKQGIGVVSNPDDHRSPEQRHNDAWENRENYEPEPKAAAVARNYRASMGLPEPAFGEQGLLGQHASLDRARQVVSYVMTQPNKDISLEERVAYNDLIRQTSMQLSAMKRAGMKVEYLSRQEIIDRGLDPQGLNPYPDATTQRNDVANGRLMIASIVDYPSSYHPILDSAKGGAYDQFRAVHDYFGHAAAGTGFDRHGEFQAWLNHTSMFTGEARRAASSELHVENSFLAVTGGSAPHFATLLPEHMVDPFTEEGVYKGIGWLTGLAEDG